MLLSLLLFDKIVEVDASIAISCDSFVFDFVSIINGDTVVSLLSALCEASCCLRFFALAAAAAAAVTAIATLFRLRSCERGLGGRLCRAKRGRALAGTTTADLPPPAAKKLE